MEYYKLYFRAKLHWFSNGNKGTPKRKGKNQENKREERIK